MCSKTANEVSRLGNGVFWEIQRLPDCFPGVLDIHQSPEFELAGAKWRFVLKLEFVECREVYVLKLHKLDCTGTAYHIRLGVRGGNVGQIESGWLDEDEAHLKINTADLPAIVHEQLTFVCTACKVETPAGDGHASSGRLIEDLKGLLISRRDSDVVLKTGAEQFECHRLILGMRSPVFLAMFEPRHGATQDQKEVVEIKDLDANILREFLHYIYTGRVENFTPVNALPLYEVACKYQMPELRADCLRHVKNNISAKNFCDVLTLSLRHEESELTHTATQFFLENAAEVAATSEWQTFVVENPTWSNELFLQKLKIDEMTQKARVSTKRPKTKCSSDVEVTCEVFNVE